MAGEMEQDVDLWGRFSQAIARAQELGLEMARRQATSDGFQIPDPFVVAEAFGKFYAHLWQNPEKMIEAQAGLARDMTQLWRHAAARWMGEAAPPVIAPAKDDRRFQDESWTDDLAFDLIKQGYLLAARWTRQAVHKADGLDPQTARKVDFYTRQVVNALAPTNFVATNPKVLKATLESRGENLVKGLEHLLDDLEKGSISLVDGSAFEVGRNLATSPGKVVFQNDLAQLIQFSPATESVHAVPLLIVPPWINKYYILDLKPKNSLIKWLVEQGFTVFCLSWVNPGPELAHKAFDDYLAEGPLAALDAIEMATGQDKVNVIGYCIGGTLTAGMLAYLAAKGDTRVRSATFLTTMTDFSEPGELGVFIDDEQLDLLERHMAQTGFLESRHMANVFNMMRDNDLIWSFVVNNYLLGRDPTSFDMLYWNSDSTRMPAMMHNFYLRKMYRENLLVKPGGLSLLGQPIDLSRITVPIYMLSTREDHIAPWKSTYRATQLYAGPVRFVLAASGHIAGVVNPPANNKYGHWTNDSLPPDPEDWLAGAEAHAGSWWPNWREWVAPMAGELVPARAPGTGALPALEDAPGSYVLGR